MTARLVRPFTLAVIGNPNTGKTTLFNALTGLNQRVGNYPGCTVEKKTGEIKTGGGTITAIDLPGLYSLAAHSPDEQVALDVLLSARGEEKIDGVLVVIDASNFNRNCYLLSQVLETGLPVVAALNMIDVADQRAIRIDVDALSGELGIPVVATNARSRKGLDSLRSAIETLAGKPAIPAVTPLLPEIDAAAQALAQKLAATQTSAQVHPILAKRALIDQHGEARKKLRAQFGAQFDLILQETLNQTGLAGADLVHREAAARYRWIDRLVQKTCFAPAAATVSFSEHVDRVLTHRLWGLLIFAALMIVLFQALYAWAAPLMDLIDSFFGDLAGTAAAAISSPMLSSLVADGMIAGVGGVLVFLPQIVILFLFIALLEDCGYLARAAFLMDKLFSQFGLSGKSFIPLMSSFACAIPGIMATRTIENRQDRLTTLLVAPLMSCSARLPVYIVFIAAFVPEQKIGGVFGLQGLTLFAMYCLGALVAVPVAWLLKKTLLKSGSSPFLMELPSYKIPEPRTVLKKAYDGGREFTLRAGTVIFAISIVIWALAYFPHPRAIADRYREQCAQEDARHRDALIKALQSHNAQVYVPGMTLEEVELRLASDARLQAALKRCAEVDAQFAADNTFTGGENSPAYEAALQNALDFDVPIRETIQALRATEAERAQRLSALGAEENGEYLRQSWFGRMGHAIEPAVKPLGWDWRIGLAALASFPAREVIISTLGIVYNLGSEQDEGSSELRAALHNATWDDGAPVFSIPVALSIMVFFALCSQCGATLAVIRRETGGWKWPVFSFVYMTVLAYLGAFATFQIGSSVLS